MLVEHLQLSVAQVRQRTNLFHHHLTWQQRCDDSQVCRWFLAINTSNRGHAVPLEMLAERLQRDFAEPIPRTSRPAAEPITRLELPRFGKRFVHVLPLAVPSAGFRTITDR